MKRLFCLVLSITLIVAADAAMAQAPGQAPGQTPASRPAGRQGRGPGQPARDPHSPGYVTAKELPDGAVPPPDADGNFIIGPTHPKAPGNDRQGRRAAGTV